MTGNQADPLALGQQLVAILEGGRRTATYKLATMVALLEICIESVPDDHAAAVSIDLDLFAHRVMSLYWHQFRPILIDRPLVLAQTSQPGGKIFRAITTLRAHVIDNRQREIPFETAVIRVPEVYEHCRTQVKRSLVEMPLKRLQQVGSGSYECYLYDDGWMGRDSLKAIVDQGNQLVLLPGVCHALARLAPLVKPAFQLAWADDVHYLASGFHAFSCRE